MQSTRVKGESSKLNNLNDYGFNYNLMLLDHHNETNYSNPAKCSPTERAVAGTVAFVVDTTS